MEPQPAYVLHTRPFRDTSLIVEAFSREQGRLGMVLRGARRRGKRATTPAQPFSPVLISWGGRGELKTAHLFEAAGPPLRLSGVALVSGLYLNELLLRLLAPQDPHPLLFDHYCQTLDALRSDPAIDIALRRFELSLLDELGYGIGLTEAADTGEALEPGRRYRLEPGLGLVDAPSGAPNAMAGAGGTFLGEDLLNLARGHFTDAVRRAAKRLCRQLIDEHLGGRPLQARALLPGQR